MAKGGGGGGSVGELMGGGPQEKVCQGGGGGASLNRLGESEGGEAAKETGNLGGGPVGVQSI